jgi:hypothetical protein
MLTSVFTKLGLEATYLKDVAQSGPGYDVEQKSTPGPLEFSSANRDNIIAGLERKGWDARLAETAYDALLETSVL